MTMENLIEILLDQHAEISDRDDAAMDLADYDDALEILIKVASNTNENPIILGSCGTSIAEIWKRLAVYDQGVVDGLALDAQSEIKAAFF